jgi:CelD/BcsL family acetyltransferase involved in cellulose biosynthesis
MIRTENWELVLEPVSSIEALSADWQGLEERAELSFFQSWGWIGTWLSVLPPELLPYKLCVRYNGRIVGLGLLRQSQQIRHRILRSDVLHLSETGIDDFDGLTIEHNGFIVDGEVQKEVTDRVFRWFAHNAQDSDEIFVRGMNSTLATDYSVSARKTGLISRITDEAPYYFVDLDRIRTEGKDYLGSLSRNSRYQIRRAIKRYAATGSLQTRKAKDLQEAIDIFGSLRGYHQQYWEGKGESGAFGSPFRQRFHDELIRSRFDAGEVDMVEVSSGDGPVGFLYNFRFRGCVSNYQSGFRYPDDTQLKPGLVTHALTAQQYLENGDRIYDFLMGDHRYKQSLSNSQGQMCKLVVQKPLLRFRLENFLRRSRNAVRSRLSVLESRRRRHNDTSRPRRET